MKYVVLLRGINISGKNKILMSDLKFELKNIKYTNVITYLNSGNIILESDKSKQEITTDIHKMIKYKFNLDIPVFVIDYMEIYDLLNNAPSFWGTNNREMYDNIIFVIEPFKAEQIIADLGDINKEIEHQKAYKNNIFWSYELKNYLKSKWWNKLASRTIKDKVTIRTANTIKKVFEICNR